MWRSDHNRRVPDSQSAQALCRSCGLCCDGTLFATVPVRETDNIAAMAAAGIEVETRAAGRCFTQPCAAHTGRSCRVYDARPSECREFRCKLLIDRESGEVDWPRAFERVGQALALKRAVTEELERAEPALAGRPWAGLMKPWTNEDDPAGSPELRRKYARALVAMVSLARYLDRHFRPN